MAAVAPGHDSLEAYLQSPEPSEPADLLEAYLNTPEPAESPSIWTAPGRTAVPGFGGLAPPPAASERLLEEFTPIGGVPQMWRGVTEPGLSLPRRITEVGTGLAKSLTPLALPALAVAPLATATGLGVGAAAMWGTKKALEMAGATPEWAEAGGVLAGFGLPAAGGMALRTGAGQRALGGLRSIFRRPPPVEEAPFFDLPEPSPEPPPPSRYEVLTTARRQLGPVAETIPARVLGVETPESLAAEQLGPLGLTVSRRLLPPDRRPSAMPERPLAVELPTRLPEATPPAAPISAALGKDLSPEMLAKLAPTEREGIMERLAMSIESDPGEIPHLPTMLDQYGLTNVEMARWLRQKRTDSARFIGYWGHISRRVMRLKEFREPAVMEVLGEPGTEAAAAADSFWWTNWDRALWALQFRKTHLVAQWTTMARNSIDAAGYQGLHLIEDALDGIVKTGRGMPREAAFARAHDDVMAIGRALRLRNLEQAHQILADMPLEQRRLFGTPMADLVTLTGEGASAGQKALRQYVRVLQMWNRPAEEMFRRLSFDSELRSLLGEAGYKTEGLMPQDWNIPKDVLAEMTPKAVDHALTMTRAADPAGRFSKAIVQLFRRFPLFEMVQPFPRYYYGNAWKFMFDYSPAGFLNKAAQQAFRTGKDHRPIIRAMEGTAALIWATAYRYQDGAPADWYKVRLPGALPLVGGKEVDIRPFAPVPAAYLFLGEALAGVIRGEQRLTSRDVLMAALGMNRLAGSGLAIVDAMLDAQNDERRLWNTIKYVGGSLVGGFTVPFRQIKDLVAAGAPEERIYRDVRGREFLGPSMQNIPFVSQILPPKPAVVAPGMIGEHTPAWQPLVGQLTGFRFREPPSTPAEEEFRRLNVPFGSIKPPSSGRPEIDRRAEEMLGEYLGPQIAEIISRPAYQEMDDAGRKDWLLKILGRMRSAAAQQALAEAGQRRATRLERLRTDERLFPR